jgi:hypothetical protein
MSLESDERNVPHRYTFAAGYVITEYLRMIPTGPESNSFFNFAEKAPDGSPSYKHSLRLSMVGSCLFRLRRQPGFSEFCRRFRGRDFRSTLYELVAACSFLRGCFQLHAKPEIGVKKADFDFQAVRPEDNINVEVTALTAKEFSEKTVKSALNAKRKQLPDDLPAIIFCSYPETWFNIGDGLLQFNLMKAANKFFSSKRINAVVFMGEQHWDKSGDGTLGALSLTQLPVVNSSARHKISSLDFLLNIGKDSPRSMIESGDLGRIAQKNEFYQFVDDILAETPS